jgi:hypothetical protein
LRRDQGGPRRAGPPAQDLSGRQRKPIDTIRRKAAAALKPTTHGRSPLLACVNLRIAMLD